ncbi:enoyl-CoA hydratase/isomerase family protein [Streptomyces arenae]|uniref:enoyl-CoA hydratase/isomerase family protein n=1 Tax=Streptomyces arenae TaxID=29301 RepID=UPI0026598D39|nr:enoyl-CoA hydratase/isomerase family protein [Streptomyces arenae]MCG7205574.1 enoyl-CoA hydratase/isomerase family protein [Streptomyces arenae]
MATWTSDRFGPVAVLTFTRKPGNFMDFGSMIQLGALLEDLGRQADQVKVVVLTGGLDDRFIDHAELSDLARAGAGLATAEELGSWSRALRLLEEIPQPTVAAVDGLASGGGNEIALACTLRAASPRSRFQQPEAAAGIIPGGGGSVRLPRLIGPGRAAEAILTGRLVHAEEALRVGWVNTVLTDADFVADALRWVGAVARNPGPALYAAKHSVVAGSRLPFGDAITTERRLFGELTADNEALSSGS